MSALIAHFHDFELREVSNLDFTEKSLTQLANVLSRYPAGSELDGRATNISLKASCATSRRHSSKIRPVDGWIGPHR